MLGHAGAVVVFRFVVDRHALSPMPLYHLFPPAGSALPFDESQLCHGAMKVDGRDMRTIWVEPDGWSVGIIDQTALPHQFTTVRLSSVEDVARAIAIMQVRGAPLI